MEANLVKEMMDFKVHNHLPEGLDKHQRYLKEELQILYLGVSINIIAYNQTQKSICSVYITIKLSFFD